MGDMSRLCMHIMVVIDGSRWLWQGGHCGSIVYRITLGGMVVIVWMFGFASNSF